MRKCMALRVPGVVLVVCVLAWGVSTGSPPMDAKIYPVGETDTPYEELVAGTPGGTLYLVCHGNPVTWNDAVASDANTWRFTSLMLRGLVDIDPMTGELVPDLCRSWSVSEDGLAITFEMRRGILWSDGVPITADDVVFTLNDIVLNRDVSCGARDGLQLPNGEYPEVKALDSHTVVVRLSVPFRPILNALGFSILPCHVLSEFVHKVNPNVPAGSFASAWDLATPLADLVCSGPYVPVEYLPNVRVVLERNPEYWAFDSAGTRLPYYDRIVYSIVSGHDVALLKFLNGEIDCLAPDAADLEILTSQSAWKGFTVMTTEVPERGTTWLCLNQDFGIASGSGIAKRELYRDVRFREAIAHCVDKPSMIGDVLNGLGVELWSPVNVVSPFYASRDHYGGPILEGRKVSFSYDLDLAVELLDEIGVVDQDGDGWRDLEDGKPLSIEIATCDCPHFIGYGTILVDSLQSVGLSAHIAISDLETLTRNLLEGTGDATILGLTGGDEPHSGLNVYGSCGVLHIFRLSACGEPEEADLRIDELYSLAAGARDMEEAFGYYQEAQNLIAQQLGFIYLVGELFNYCYYDHVGNAFASSPLSWPDGPNGLLTELLFDKRLL